MPQLAARSVRTDPVRLIARLLCVVFGLIGALPVLADMVLRLDALQGLAARETARVLQLELGVTATYEVKLHLFPLELSIRDLKIPSTDGQGPALTVEELNVRPRIFGLLAGRLDVGDVSLSKPRARVVVRNGKLVNVRYRLPEAPQPSRPEGASPFSSLSVTDARAVLDIDGTRIDTGSLDLDVFAEAGPSFEILVSASGGSIERPRLLKPASDSTASAIDEDVVCRLDVRARVAGREILVRRLSALAVADLDANRGTQPQCDAGEEALGRVALRLSQLRLSLREGERPYVAGHVVVRAPLGLFNRALPAPHFGGWAGFAGDVRYDGSTRLPAITGRLTGAGVAIEEYLLATQLAADVHLTKDVIQIPRFAMGFSDGQINIDGGRLEPLASGFPLFVERLEGRGILFETMMRHLDVTPDTIVRWNLQSTRITKLGGTLSPVKIDGELAAETRDFEIFDRAFHDKNRRHMIGVKSSTLRGKIGVRPNALLIYDTRADFGKSSMFVKLVSIGFDNTLELQVSPGSKLNLADISPLIDIPMKGDAQIEVKMAGRSKDPLLKGNLAIAGFEFGGFPIGDITSSELTFRPLWVQIANAKGKKGQSDFVVPTGRIDFGTRASLLIEAHVQSEALEIRDFFHMFHFDEDPRFADIRGRTAVDANIRYVLGGPEDRCRGGVLHTTGTLKTHELALFDERYDGGYGKFDFLWNDRDATYRGIRLDVPEFTLRKGSGSLSGKLEMRPGAHLSGELTANAVPIGKIDALPTLIRAAEGTLDASGIISGTVDALELEVSADISELRTGRTTLPGSNLVVKLEPIVRADPPVRMTRCGQPVSAPFAQAEYDRDLPSGVFRTSGTLLGRQIVLDDLGVTRQRSKTVRGDVHFSNLDLGALLELVPELALAKERPTGRISASLRLDHLEMQRPSLARGSAQLTALSLQRAGYKAELATAGQAITFGGGAVSMPPTALAFTTPRGQRVTFDAAGRITDLGGPAPASVDATLNLQPMPLASLVGVLPRVERASGTLKGTIRLTGPLAEPRYSGGLEVARGEFAVRGLPSPITDFQLALAIDANEISVSRGSARLGNGALSFSGEAPIRGGSLAGEVRLRIGAREIALPSKDGLRAVADAELLATYRPPREDSEPTRPRITGNVMLRSFEYRRPVTIAADLNALAQRGKRTTVVGYDPSEDVVEFDLNIKAQRPLRIQNDLIEADLVLAEEGLMLTGTNARHGLRGNVHVRPGGRIVLRRSEFEIREGSVRFDDTTRIAPQVDVTAVTEYRRYSDAPGSSSQAASAASATTSATSATGGRWNISMHAYGDADNLRVDLTSDPALPQDDIFLLLTVGLTRAELDQARSASVGESVALEALGTLTGADRAVKDAVPLIDEFRFGSAYSSRTGRTEPTVTVGKRLTERVRANVTSGLSETREIRSNVEWRLSPRVSVEGSYDNINDISSSSLGNLGADVRWRLEFE